ncbi:MAG: hypothetical protein UT11_C0051G0007 [Berkelbacteria bacterium GW2011_GWA2_38_9]|uniref:(d)CMP kinase n=1 Tax=Berkelbacteria bacterium GW2011_GWA2_38_9 TaxID=1618334 RepID=A0A0G0NNM2_9BACT|nr:MAG: hypothetical protein UT11_C0051G0007 [Berkelbacteria bacterium GW2011_GWA2_38_9]
MEIKNNPFRLITVSGASGTGKSLLTKQLASILGWPIFSVSSLQRENAKKYHLSADQIHQLPKSVHQSVDQQMISTIKRKENKILESRLCGWQSRNYSDILRILCICDSRISSKRYASREKIPVKKARQEILDRDKNNLENYTELYKASDYLDPKYYQLVIDSSSQTPAQEVEAVIDFIKSK